jgi:hypothetical protein
MNLEVLQNVVTGCYFKDPVSKKNPFPCLLLPKIFTIEGWNHFILYNVKVLTFHLFIELIHMSPMSKIMTQSILQEKLNYKFKTWI